MTVCKLFCMMLIAAFPAHALVVDAPLRDRAMEARAQALFRDVRCVVCAGEAIADSPALVAADMRRAVRQQIAEGKTDATIRNELVAQYGERVLMLPSFAKNLWLWLTPLLLLAAGMVLAWRHVFGAGDDE